MKPVSKILKMRAWARAEDRVVECTRHPVWNRVWSRVENRVDRMGIDAVDLVVFRYVRSA